jgi:glutaconate CoA-transferase subunit A
VGSTIDTLTIDCADPTRVAAFWCSALGYELVESDDEVAEIRDPSGAGWPLLFQMVPEGKSVKNRLHLDIRASASMAAEVDRLKGFGATEQRFVEEGGSFWTVMLDAVAELVHDGDTVAIEGFTHLICFAAGHEIIRQRKRDLTLARLTPDVIYDQMIGAGVARKLVFSWLGNPGVGSLHAVRRRIEHADPAPLEIEEYSHFGMVCRYVAGASNLPFFPIRSYYESDIPEVNRNIVPMRSPYEDGTEVYVVPPLRPDVTIVHAQRATVGGDTQIWGLLGCQKEAAFAAKRVIVVCEEVVDEATVRRDPNRTVIPGVVVDAVVEQPFACHPSYAQGYYDRDNAFYLEWEQISKDPVALEAWLQEWVHDLATHEDYREKMGAARWDTLRPGEQLSGQVNYGDYA